MPQFAVYKNKNPKSKSAYPYLVDVQSDLLSGLQTRAVVPLAKLTALRTKPIRDLTPVVNVDGNQYLVLVPQLAGIAVDELGSAVGSIASRRNHRGSGFSGDRRLIGR